MGIQKGSFNRRGLRREKANSNVKASQKGNIINKLPLD